MIDMVSSEELHKICTVLTIARLHPEYTLLDILKHADNEIFLKSFAVELQDELLELQKDRRAIFELEESGG